jgi:hypothetical protein
MPALHFPCASRPERGGMVCCQRGRIFPQLSRVGTGGVQFVCSMVRKDASRLRQTDWGGGACLVGMLRLSGGLLEALATRYCCIGAYDDSGSLTETIGLELEPDSGAGGRSSGEFRSDRGARHRGCCVIGHDDVADLLGLHLLGLLSGVLGHRGPPCAAGVRTSDVDVPASPDARSCSSGRER